MALDFNGPATIVLDAYNRSVALATSAKSDMTSFLAALNGSVYEAPKVDVKFTALATPSMPAIPGVPTLPTSSFVVPANQPGAITSTLPAIQIDEFTGVMPALSTAAPPQVQFGAVPALPTIREVAIPDAPTVNLPALPDLLQLDTHTFGGINLHEDWLDKLREIPELTILQPTKLQYTRGPAYTSQLLDNLKANLNSRMQGGTGLSPGVEQAIWDRARDRETQVALSKEQEVMRSFETFGFPMPAGAIVGQLADARREYQDKLSGLSRDIAIKQADLEQQNLRDAISAATQLEAQLIDYSYKIEQLAFEAAKALADNEIAAFNSNIEHYKALLAGYQAYEAAYDTLIKSELAKIEVFKALLSAEQTKAQINATLVQQYRVQIDGALAGIEVYKAQISGALALVEVEKSRIAAAGEQIRAFVAVNNAEMSKVELYKAQISADNIKMDGYRTQVQAYTAKAGAQAEKARVAIAGFQALISAKGLEWDGWKARLSAEVAKVDVAAKQSSILVDGYKVGATAAQAQAELSARMWEASMRQYESAQTITLQAAKINTDALMHTNDARMEAAKVGAQVMSQQTASAFNIVNTSASISGSNSTFQTLFTPE